LLLNLDLFNASNALSLDIVSIRFFQSRYHLRVRRKEADLFRWLCVEGKSKRGQRGSRISHKRLTQARSWWLIPVILTTQEAEIRKIVV
jgi:hypothetical protein